MSVLIGAVAAPRNDLTLAEAVGFADGIAPVFLTNFKKVRRLEAPKLVGSADCRRSLAGGKVAHGHLGRFLGNRAGGNADHGADGVKITFMEKLPLIVKVGEPPKNSLL